jgi:hypothetical protein
MADLATNEEWIDQNATEVVNTILEVMRNDHEDERTHDDSQEYLEGLVRSRLRKAIKLAGGSTDQSFEDPEKPGPLPEPKYQIASPLSPLHSTTATGLEIIRDMLFAHCAGAPQQAWEEISTRAARFYWDEQLKLLK